MKAGAATQVAPYKTALGTQATRNGSGTLTPGLPAGTAVGDLLLVMLYGTSMSSDWTISGYTAWQTIATGQNDRFSVFYRFATGSDTCSFSNPSSGFNMARIIGYRGVLTTGPFENTQAALDIFSDGANASYASFSSSGPQRTMIQMYGNRNPTSSTPDTGWTEDMDTFGTDEFEANYGLQIDEKVLPTQGGGGTGTHLLNATPTRSHRTATCLVPL